VDEPVTTLVAAGDDVEITGEPDARYPIYSVSKTAVAAAVLLLVREGAVELDRVIELARTLSTSQQLTPLCISHASHVFRCVVTGEAAPALTHGRAAVDCAERTGNHASRTFAYFQLGLANVLNRVWRDALEALE
jgi:hypothetical protein